MPDLIQERLRLEQEKKKQQDLNNGSFPYLLPSKNFKFNEGSVPFSLQKHFQKRERRFLMNDPAADKLSIPEVLEKFHDFVVGNLQVRCLVCFSCDRCMYYVIQLSFDFFVMMVLSSASSRSSARWTWTVTVFCM
jgi:hypothetical protein